MRFNFLGPLEVRDGERLVALGGPQQHAVLAVLLAHTGQVVSTDRIADQLWAEAAPPRARSLVQGCVAGLRRALRSGPGDLLITRAHGYLLQLPPGSSDRQRFDELTEAAQRFAAEDSPAQDSPAEASALFREALALWRGPAFDGIDTPVCRAEAARLEERRLTVLEECIQAELLVIRPASLVAELQSLVRDHPLRESFWAYLMTALHRSDRRADALAVYRTARRTLVTELGIEPGPVLRELHRRILEPEDPVPAPRRPPESAPAQLPAAVSAFTGRQAYLKRLDALVSQRADTVAIGVICGTAGVGKTTLAVEWAHRVADRLDGGQLYVNLHGYATSPPLQPIEALSGFLQAVGVTAEQMPNEPEQAAAMYRTLLAGRRMLVVLDNASSVEQVRPLLPGGAGSVVLITSRDTLGGLVARDGAEHLRLGVLDPREAEALLARVLGAERVAAEPAAVAELARLCAYLPLALRIAAANLTLAPDSSVAGQVAELRGAGGLGALTVDGDDAGAVRAAFDLSYARLDPPTRRLFALLGVAPGRDVAVADAAALAGPDTGTDAGPARAALARLARAHLIDARGDRYAFHDLLRLYAAERAAAEDRDGALRRLYEHYVRRAEAAAEVLYPHMLRLHPPQPDTPRMTHAEALAWLTAERHNLVLAVQAAAEHGPRASGGLLADALRGYFHLSRHTADWLTVADAALVAARLDGDVRAQAAALHSLGTARRSLGEFDAAFDHYTEALRLARACGWTESEATTLGNLGIVGRKQGRLAEAAAHLDAALVVDRRSGRPAGEANNLGNLAAVYRDMGRLAEAAECFTAALTLNRTLGSAHGEALALTGLGQVCQDLGHLDEARRHLDAALQRYVQVGDRDGETVIECCLAELDCDLGRPARAQERAAAALEVARETSDRQTEIMALNALGRADGLLGHHRRAIDRHRLAYDLARRTASLQFEGLSLLGLAVVHRRLGRHDDAAGFALRAQALARRAGMRALEDRAQATLTAA
ncbi:DNA-binding SARP family transcriptional activator [Actinoplanes tereljensis]|uniref:SARP family transcriptional regulator n=1 Tax=Paractinoplanes tereljensis TaxID=571912 RepID=A0A919TTH6_9ACTN|nr:BTAD domain-containing putative transcriptional regulator [Actinoplanes tereljensis]GIF20390.1 SARP family transcriptional regulator [Actinoplanes tereljensis]